MSVLSNYQLTTISLFVVGLAGSILTWSLQVNRFNERSITQFSYEDSHLETITASGGSNLVCGAMCLASSMNCTGFTFDGNRCHLLRSWSFASESYPSVDAIKVHEMNVSAWSKFMIIGGKATGFWPSADVEVIDMANEKHCPNQSSLPTVRFGMPSFVLGSKLLTIGGIGNELDITSYNYENHSWDSIGTVGAEWSDYSIAQIQDSWILLMGGYYGVDATGTTIILNPNGSMIPGPDLPEANDGFCACGLDDNHIFIAGGKDLDGSHSRTSYVLDWASQQWTNLDPMALPRYYVECGTFLSTDQELNVLVVGGLRNNMAVGPHTEIFNWPQRTWRDGPDFAYPAIFLSRMTNFDGKLFVFGGYDDTSATFLSSIYTFIPKNESWVKFPLELNIARRDFGIMKIPDGIVDC